jgi:hypothetical protein
MVTSASLSAGVVNLPRTGQTICYDSTGFVIDCIDTGQDGDRQPGVTSPFPRFTNNSDGTITDNLTGLMWLQNGNLFGEGSRMEWEDALYNLARMNAGLIINFGYTDWRVPNVNELESLLNIGVSDQAAWLNSQGFINVQSSAWYYWSSTMAASYGGSLAWGVRMSDGKTQVLPISGTENGRNHFWAVRAGQIENPDHNFPANVWKTGQTTAYYWDDDGSLKKGVAWPVPRFSDNGNGTITDNLTGLMWLKDTNCIYSHYPGFDTDWAPGDGAVLWQTALDFVAGINSGIFSGCAAGYNDWRLPNVKELRSLIDHSQYGPPLPLGHPFVGSVGPTTLWSSNTYAPEPDCAWSVDYLSGVTSGEFKLGGWANSYFGVLPVRAGAIDTDGDGLFDSIENGSPCLDVNDADTDDDGILDGTEDKNHNGAVDAGETNPCDKDSDDDGILDGSEDKDHDGLLDAGETDPSNSDTDGDGIQDGTESGLTLDKIGPDTDTAKFIPDADPLTKTNPLDNDTDNDGIKDGKEDKNFNGMVDDGETDPNVFNRRLLPFLQLLIED